MRLALISDVHEDVRQLKHILKKIDVLGYDQLICLGDISGFSVPYYSYSETRNAHDCLSLLRERETIILPGNHDFFAARTLPKISDVFDFPENWYELDVDQQAVLSNNELWLHDDELDTNYNFEDIDYLSALPEYHVMETGGQNILFSHYVFPNMAGFKKEFYSRGSDFKPHFEFMEKQDCLLSFTGHMHCDGFYTVEGGQFNEYRYRKLRLKNFPCCVGIPPVTTHSKRSGFCIFDTEKSLLRTIRS